MKEFIFVSDFDGTMTAKDFYHIIMDQYLGEWGRELYASWKRNEMMDVEFLTTVFKSINRTEEEIYEDILSIQLDKSITTFIEFIKNNGGDFLVLSAGTQYYIKRLLDFEGLHGVEIIANDGKYEDKGIALIPPDKKHPFYSQRYGIDKAKVVQSLKQKYKKVYYAGDGGPDVSAALLADTTFAKGTLINLLQKEATEYVPFEYFSQIKEYLKSRG